MASRDPKKLARGAERRSSDGKTQGASEGSSAVERNGASRWSKGTKEGRMAEMFGKERRPWGKY